MNWPLIVVEAETESAEVVAAVAERLSSVVSPVFDMEKRLEVTLAEVVEETAKSVVVAVVEAALIERRRREWRKKRRVPSRSCPHQTARWRRLGGPG